MIFAAVATSLTSIALKRVLGDPAWLEPTPVRFAVLAGALLGYACVVSWAYAVVFPVPLVASCFFGSLCGLRRFAAV